jgi:hypothetical protein
MTLILTVVGILVVIANVGAWILVRVNHVKPPVPEPYNQLRREQEWRSI